MAYIARENLRNETRNKYPTVKDLWKGYKGIQILGQDESPQLINGKFKLKFEIEHQLKLVPAIECFREEARNIADKPLKKIYEV